MKICLVSHSFLPEQIGGAELTVHHLARQFANRGHETTVLTNSSYKSEKFHPNYTMRYYPKTPKAFLQGQIFAMYLLILQLRKKFDLIHFHKAYMAYYATKIRHLLKVPIIVTSHGGDIQTCPEINYGKRLDAAWDNRIQYTIRNADLLTAIGSSTRKEYMAIGAKKENIVDIPNGVDLERFNADCQDIRDVLDLPKDIRIILTVGRHIPAKGYEYLIEAMAYIKDQYQNVKCLMVGRELNELINTINRFDVSKYVILLDQQSFNSLGNGSQIDHDRLPNDTLLACYKSSDIYVSASLIEGFPLVVVESMAAGLPIVATKVPGNEDAVAHGGNGFLVAAKDPKTLAEKIVTLLKNEKLKDKFGRRSKKLAKNYDWDLIVSKYLVQYSLLLNRDLRL